MKINRLSARQIKEASVKTEKRTIKRIIIWAVLIVVSGLIFEFFYSNGDEMIYKYRENAFYGKAIPADLICMNGNYFMKHKTKKFVFNNWVYYMCSENCEIALINDYSKVGFAKDTISGNRINKAEAIPGLRQKSKPEIIYFNDKKNFQAYYKNEKKKSK